LKNFLGEGTFGKVAKCTNLSTNKEVAIKIIKKGFNHTCVDWFHYKSHVCMVFEMLDQSLFDFMKDRRSRPLFVQEIRDIAWQLLVSLKGLKSINLVHCDIKLDNIMLVNQASEPFRVKLIDFGLTKKTTDMRTGTRMQNICFRAPEVILGLPLDERLDMWTGMPDNEHLDQGLYTNKFFTKTEENSKVVWKLDTPEQQSKKTGGQVKDEVDCWSFDELKYVYCDETKMEEVEQLIDLLKQMLEVDPNKRISPNDALRHPFFKLEMKKPSVPHRLYIPKFLQQFGH
uniref:Protein kinase domain-containing protein n=1 Tax=Oryzias sinensis TaxID=183150 RepID=A0A8C7XPZ0_9TELE